MSDEKGAAYWRGLLAAAADVKMSVVTQFSPEGFAAAIGQPRWYYVALGELVLCHDGEWFFPVRRESLESRMRYAHKTACAALEALRREVAPDEPLCAEVVEAVYKDG